MLDTAGAKAVDALDVLIFGRWPQLPGAALFALVFLAAAVWLFNHPRFARVVPSDGEPSPLRGAGKLDPDHANRRR